MQSVGFKEWAVVCDALGRGEQTVILRKGGIAEGRDGFTFRHEEFFLFPTFFHEQLEKTRLRAITLPEARAGEIEIRFLARVERAVVIDSWKIAEALEPLHSLQSRVVRERFDYDEAARLHVAFVKIFRVEPAWIFPDAPAYGGCRSWVKLPERAEDFHLAPVLSENENARRRAEFDAAVAG